MNYAQLKSAIEAWAHSTTVTPMIPTLVALAEARIARDFRLRAQVTPVNITADAATAALPADFLEFKALVYVDSAIPLQVGSMEAVLSERARISGYRPKLCTVNGTNLNFGPVPDSAYTISAAYYAKFPALSGDGDTNWLLTNHPGVYLWAALSEVAPYLVEDQRTVTWEGKYMQEKNALIKSDRDSEFSGTGLQAFPINAQQVV